MPNVMLLGYGLDQPSYRHRMRTLVEPLQAAGWQVRCEQFPGGRYGLRTWERRHLLRWAQVTVLHQIKLSSVEARLFASFSRRRVFDVDDAIYVRKPRRLGDLPDESAWRKQKFAATCRWADVVAAGNDVLAGVAHASAREISVLPTSIDAACYQPTTAGPMWPPPPWERLSPKTVTPMRMLANRVTELLDAIAGASTPVLSADCWSTNPTRAEAIST